jgi:hypothetical protein
VLGKVRNLDGGYGGEVGKFRRQLEIPAQFFSIVLSEALRQGPTFDFGSPAAPSALPCSIAADGIQEHKVAHR